MAKLVFGLKGEQGDASVVVRECYRYDRENRRVDSKGNILNDVVEGHVDEGVINDKENRLVYAEFKAKLEKCGDELVQKCKENIGAFLAPEDLEAKEVPAPGEEVSQPEAKKVRKKKDESND